MIMREPVEDEERRMADLRFGEQFFVWALRAWMRCSQSENDVGAALAIGFRLAKIDEALVSLDYFMRVLSRARTRPVEIRCMHCASVSADEELLLHAAGALQAERHMAAHILLHRYLPCAAVRMATPSLEALAEHMRRRGLIVEQNECGRAHLNGLAMDAMLPSPAVH